MTIDRQIWALAVARCQASGWNNSQDFQTMAEAIQDVILDIEAEREEAVDAER